MRREPPPVRIRTPKGIMGKFYILLPLREKVSPPGDG
jgi:hypothetical protein